MVPLLGFDASCKPIQQDLQTLLSKRQSRACSLSSYFPAKGSADSSFESTPVVEALNLTTPKKKRPAQARRIVSGAATSKASAAGPAKLSEQMASSLEEAQAEAWGFRGLRVWGLGFRI